LPQLGPLREGLVALFVRASPCLWRSRPVLNDDQDRGQRLTLGELRYNTGFTMTLRFSVIVPTLNRRQMLLAALASVRAQQWPNTEIIVVDGGSNDGTLQELEKLKDIHLVLGPDRGVYDAFNKGIARAGGDVIGILNSDDSYEPGAFTTIADAFTETAQAVCGTALVVENDRVITVFDRENDKLLVSPRTALIGSCSINARFFRRTAMERVGLFNLEYKYVSDRDWLTRWYEAGLPTLTVANVVYRYQQHPGSLTFDADRRRELQIREELVRLARYWRKGARASNETKQIAAVLEGRCVAYLAIAALRDGRFGEAKRWLAEEDGQPSISPVSLITRSAPDWLRETWIRRTPSPVRTRSDP
jgi:glycosyltransferase involved in cell wall biosynthesis